MLFKLQNSSRPIWPCKLHDNILRVLNGNNNPSSKLKFLMGFANVDDEYIIRSTLEDVALHLEITVLGAEVNFGSKHHLDFLLLPGKMLHLEVAILGAEVNVGSKHHLDFLLLLTQGLSSSWLATGTITIKQSACLIRQNKGIFEGLSMLRIGLVSTCHNRQRATHHTRSSSRIPIEG